MADSIQNELDKVTYQKTSNRPKINKKSPLTEYGLQIAASKQIGRCKISLSFSNMTKFSGDVSTNIANKRTIRGDGLNKAMNIAAGPLMLKERIIKRLQGCERHNIISTDDDDTVLPFGCCISINSGDLPSSHSYHIGSPDLRMNDRQNPCIYSI